MEIQPNEMCPCGRGRKYKKCCKKQGIIWYREEDGSYTQEYRALMPQEMIEVLKSLVIDFMHYLVGNLAMMT